MKCMSIHIIISANIMLMHFNNRTRKSKTFIAIYSSLLYNSILILVFTLAAKPNVKLEYNIGTSFCIEDPVNTSVQFTVICTLEELGVPTPDLQLNIFLDGTNLDSNNSNISIMILSTNNYAGNVTFNDTMIVEGTIQMDSQSTLLITCMVNNTFGTHIVTTSIRLCGKLVTDIICLNNVILFLCLGGVTFI